MFHFAEWRSKGGKRPGAQANFLVFVDRRRKNISCFRSQGTLVTPLILPQNCQAFIYIDICYYIDIYSIYIVYLLLIFESKWRSGVGAPSGWRFGDLLAK